MVVGSLLPDMFPGLRNSAFAVFLVPDWYNKMPDVDSYDSSSGIAVDVQQRLNCALPSFFLEPHSLSFVRSSRHV